jgi:hypothetical protein
VSQRLPTTPWVEQPVTLLPHVDRRQPAPAAHDHPEHLAATLRANSHETKRRNDLDGYRPNEHR